MQYYEDIGTLFKAMQWCMTVHKYRMKPPTLGKFKSINSDLKRIF